MSKPLSQRDEIREILFAARDNQATDEQLSRLDELVRANQEHREFAVKYVHLFSALHWNIAGARETPADAAPAPMPQTAPADGRRGMLARPRLTSVVIAATSLALVLLVLALIGPPMYRSQQPTLAQLSQTAGARWGADSSVRRAGDSLRLGDQLQLDGGLVELEFADGARVRLRGPCHFALLGPRHCDLKFGHAMVIASAGFQVSAPRAHLTDQGTVFAVQAARHTGQTDVHVFEGAVDAELTDRHGNVLKRMRLAAGEAVEWTPAEQAVSRPAVLTARLPDLSKWRPLALTNTGQGLTAGQIDRHWEVSAAQGTDGLAPGPAPVTTPAPTYLPPDANSAWLGRVDQPGAAVVTFRTRFDLTNVDPATARITGRFSADNQLRSIRINGRQVSVPAHQPEDFARFLPFQITSGFVAGTNTLEFTVANKPPALSLLSLRVELSGEAQARD